MFTEFASAFDPIPNRDRTKQIKEENFGRVFRETQLREDWGVGVPDYIGSRTSELGFPDLDRLATRMALSHGKAGGRPLEETIICMKQMKEEKISRVFRETDLRED